MEEYISKEKVLNIIEHNDRICHYAEERYENIVYATARTICKVVAEMPAADVQFINKDFLLWLLNKAMECMCDGRWCENCSFEKENNSYNTDCSKLTFEQLLSICKQLYRKDCDTNE